MLQCMFGTVVSYSDEGLFVDKTAKEAMLNDPDRALPILHPRISTDDRLFETVLLKMNGNRYVRLYPVPEVPGHRENGL